MKNWNDEEFKEELLIFDGERLNGYDAGFTSVDCLHIASVKDISSIKGISKKKAKEIIKELEGRMFEDREEMFEEDEWVSIEEIETDVDEWVPADCEENRCPHCGQKMEVKKDE